MNKRARSIFAVATLATALVATGCSADAGAPSSSADDGVVIGYDSYFVGNTWSAQLEAEFSSAAERLGDEIEDVIITQSNNDAQTQISNVQSLIARDVDAIIVTPISPEGIAPVLAQAKAAGIVVVLSASGADSDAYASYVNVNDTDFGATGAEWLADELGGEGRIVALNGIAGIPTSDERWKGAQEVFAEYPGIEIVSTIDGQWDQATAKTAVEDVLAANPDIDGVWSQGGSMTLGAIEAFEAAGVPLVPMTGEDSNGLLKKWQSIIDSGDTGFDAIAVAKPTWISATALETALAAVKGDEVEKDQILEPEVITADNIGDFVRPDMPDSLWVNTKMTDDEILALFG
ncbi:MAG: periplasmic binding protein/LacI transcriptional regulator [Agromyces sp.]|jgi:ribose transport system substrate-binding protein|nr:periplasmic binding protein/LacI transcriptional regulator [Agromyces sp.]